MQIFKNEFKLLGIKPKYRKKIKEMYEYDNIATSDFIKYLLEIKSGKKVREFILQRDPSVVKKRGVYKIVFSHEGHYYIGRSKYISDRMKQHESEIHKFFKTGTCLESHYLKKVFDYLKDDVITWIFKVELLSECNTLDELVLEEQKWLDIGKEDPLCLNMGFVSKPYHSNIKNETIEEMKARKSESFIGYPFYHNRKRRSK